MQLFAMRFTSVTNQFSIPTIEVDMYCGNCGVKLFEEDNYCRSCGRKVAKTIEPPSTSRAVRDIDSTADKTDNALSALQTPNHDDVPPIPPDSFAFAGAIVPTTYLEAESEFKEEQKGFEKTIGSLKLKYDAQGKVKFGGLLYLFSIFIFFPPFGAFANLIHINEIKANWSAVLTNADLIIFYVPAFAYLFLTLYIVFLYYRRDKGLSSWWIGSWSVLLAADALGALYLDRHGIPNHLFQTQIESLAGRLFWVGLWSIYLLCSKRVKHTFVN
ncbi:DUF2569 family protein [Desulfocurvibacter africanus]|nr:DUF2569 family protein [Desulfocurvibacter africanus]